ncbi:MAG: hypothetical protein IRY99_07850 [Isosphaeraceae bacterium]|nr:hypothetical protein [Isosphaeraceae bacterium]
MGETQGAENHDHDLIQDLSNHLDALWRYDQYIANVVEPRTPDIGRLLPCGGPVGVTGLL